MLWDQSVGDIADGDLALVIKPGSPVVLIPTNISTSWIAVVEIGRCEVCRRVWRDAGELLGADLTVVSETKGLGGAVEVVDYGVDVAFACDADAAIAVEPTLRGSCIDCRRLFEDVLEVCGRFEIGRCVEGREVKCA